MFLQSYVYPHAPILDFYYHAQYFSFPRSFLIMWLQPIQIINTNRTAYNFNTVIN